VTLTRTRLAVGSLVALAATALLWHGTAAQARLAGSGVGLGGRVAPQPSLAATQSAPGAFSIAGGVDGLYPGVTKPLTLTLTNPQHFAIVVASVTVSVQDASVGCSAANVAVTSFAGTVRVDAQASAHVTLQLGLRHQAPDACQAAVFPLRYSGLASKA
jgi:hypothetical protein